MVFIVLEFTNYILQILSHHHQLAADSTHFSTSLPPSLLLIWQLKISKPLQFQRVTLPSPHSAADETYTIPFQIHQNFIWDKGVTGVVVREGRWSRDHRLSRGGVGCTFN